MLAYTNATGKTMFEDRKKQVIAKVQACVELAKQKYNVVIANLDIKFDLKGRAAGMARVKYNHYSVRFNNQMMQDSGWQHLINDTVPHEIAHIVCFINPMLGRNHDMGWKRVCVALGGNGQRCHSEEVVYAKGNTYRYITTSNAQINVSERVHKRIQAGVEYRVKRGGAINNKCSYELVGRQGMSVQPTVPTVSTVPTVQPTFSNNLSKADAVRAKIVEVKRLNGNMNTVVVWAMQNLNMSKALANTYVKNNWSKV